MKSGLEKNVVRLRIEKDKTEIEINDKKKSIDNSLNTLKIKEIEIEKILQELSIEKSEIVAIKKDIVYKSSELSAKENDINTKMDTIGRDIITNQAILNDIKEKTISLDLSSEKLARIFEENTNKEKQINNKNNELQQTLKQIDIEKEKLNQQQQIIRAEIVVLTDDKKKLNEDKLVFLKEQQVIENLKALRQQKIDTITVKEKDVAKREADVKIYRKDIEDKEKEIKAKDLDLRMDKANYAESKNKFLILLKEKGLTPEDLQF